MIVTAFSPSAVTEDGDSPGAVWCGCALCCLNVAVLTVEPVIGKLWVLYA